MQLDQNTIRCGGAMPRRVTPGQERMAFSLGYLRDNLWSDPYHPFTLVQETEVISIWNQCHWIVAGRENHPDCLQSVSRSYRVRKINPHRRTLSTELFQVQMDNTTRCADCICDAGNSKPGNNLYVFSVPIVCNGSPADSETMARSPKRSRTLPGLAGLHQRLLAHGMN